MIIKSENYDELNILQCGKFWRVLKGTTVLCQGWPNYPYFVYEPIQWDNYQKCEQWCTNGTIGELQEDLSNLAVGFEKEFVIKS